MFTQCEQNKIQTRAVCRERPISWAELTENKVSFFSVLLSYQHSKIIAIKYQLFPDYHLPILAFKSKYIIISCNV